MDNDALESMIHDHARHSGMTPVELTRKTIDVLRMMNQVDLSKLLPMQTSEFAEASRRLDRKRQELRERMKNGTRRTPGNIRLPV